VLRLASVPGVVEWLGQPFMGPGTRLAVKATGHMLSTEEVTTLSEMNARSASARAFARLSAGARSGSPAPAARAMLRIGA
jgi:hypothetical protein